MVAFPGVCLDELVEGAVNFRDLGGHRAGPTRVRAGLLYRAGMTHRITDGGLATLTGRYGLRTAIDLRAAREREEDGVARFEQAGMRLYHAPMSDTINAPDEIRRQRYEEMRAGTFDWAASYLRLARGFPETYRRVFEIVTEPGALPAVFHCTAGRDRTGVAAALILSALGVSSDDIAADYARTGAYLHRHVHHFIRPSARMALSHDEMARVLETQAEAMEAFLEQLGREHGSVAGYLAHIGVTRAQTDALRATLLEPA